MDCSMQGFPVLHYLLEFAQTHVCWVMMPSNHLILCHPFLLLPSIFPSIRNIEENKLDLLKLHLHIFVCVFVFQMSYKEKIEYDIAINLICTLTF